MLTNSVVAVLHDVWLCVCVCVCVGSCVLCNLKSQTPFVPVKAEALLCPLTLISILPSQFLNLPLKSLGARRWGGKQL